MEENINSSNSGQSGHTLSMFVNNKPGVLMRICQTFARRGYNIDSLVVSKGRDPRFSRLTLGISGDPKGLKQIILQCEKLVDVIHSQEHTSDDSVVRELTLVKLSLKNSDQRSSLLNLMKHFGGKTVDLSESSIIIRIEGSSDKINSAMLLLSDYEIIETVRTGKVVIVRGNQNT